VQIVSAPQQADSDQTSSSGEGIVAAKTGVLRMSRISKILAIAALALVPVSGVATAKTMKHSGHSMAKNIVEKAVETPSLSTLVAAVKAADLVGTLAGPGPFTVFAPRNAAFEKLPAGTVDTLLKPENKGTLTTVLTYHVLSGRLTSRDIVAAIRRGGGKAEVTTVQGGKLTATMNRRNLILTDAKGGTSMVTMANINQSNGVVHVIDSVLMP
jgi:uncharacterized surface protein with fasciclin (FAS1) repeats